MCRMQQSLKTSRGCLRSRRSGTGANTRTRRPNTGCASGLAGTDRRLGRRPRGNFTYSRTHIARQISHEEPAFCTIERKLQLPLLISEIAESGVGSRPRPWCRHRGADREFGVRGGAEVTAPATKTQLMSRPPPRPSHAARCVADTTANCPGSFAPQGAVAQITFPMWTSSGSSSRSSGSGRAMGR